MTSQKAIDLLQNQLKKHIHRDLYQNEFSTVYDYALFPPGKMFRPILCWGVLLDQINESWEILEESTFDQFKNHVFLSNFLELHHTYTLLHDDLPCMDNDDIRRGRPATHRKFSEWKALLAGDGLLNSSYYQLSLIQHPHSQLILKLATRMLGARGLIFGQYLDLSELTFQSLELTLKTHELKTARLIQMSLLGSYLLTHNAQYAQAKAYYKFGHHLGICFQLFDDLLDLSNESMGLHELEINPWPKWPQACLKALVNSLSECQTFLKQKKNKNLWKSTDTYFSQIRDQVENNSRLIEERSKLSIHPLMRLL